MKTTNKVELNGFVGIAPEVKTLSNGSKVAHLTLATDETYKSKTGEWVKNTTWHRITLWNKAADKAGEMLKKGTRVTLTGKLVNREFTDKSGIKRNIIEIFAKSFEPLMAA
ncbi:MAG: single-stranded DNA-binding protein [Bacteroidetes bacterium]|nr:single-stranded DNA-binding protein [Bacteroidota bacterium]